ncbi:hypothetical protein [Streptomyces sp. NPDC019224]|uniref:hypothetical protein n=1 Tax=Streptomyces sp. NPDC019224 TaxID=3154484 RepID=UPI0034095851
MRTPQGCEGFVAARAPNRAQPPLGCGRADLIRPELKREQLELEQLTRLQLTQRRWNKAVRQAGNALPDSGWR